MSTLLMIRHGQASFGSENYDQLSDLGYEQSRLLGSYWAGRGLKLDACYCGEQDRQKQTFEMVAEAYRSAGLPLPEMTVDPGFNEYDAGGIFRSFFPKILSESAELRELADKFSNAARDSAEGRKAFQKGFEIVMRRWIKGNSCVNGVESWAQFQKRVINGVKGIMSRHGHGQRVALFSSGGPISMAFQWALGLPDNTGLDISWIVKNASITEFKFKPEKFTMIGFNMTPHLGDEKLVTYR